jgi:integrase
MIKNSLKISRQLHNGKIQFRVYFPKSLLGAGAGRYVWYRSEAEAQKAIRSTQQLQERFGAIAKGVTVEELVEARSAKEELSSTGLTLLDAARQVKLALEATFESKTVGDGLKLYLDEVRYKFEERKRNNPRCEPRHWRSVKRTLARIESLKDLSLREITTDELKPLFSNLTKSSLQGHFRNLHAAFQYCVDHRWLEENPAQGLRRMKPGKASERRVVRTYRVEEVERIMTATVKVDTRLVPYLAVCFFAGVRPEAAMKMKWSDVNSNGYLYVPHTINKSGHAYSAKMQDVLVRWLLWWETQGNQRSGDILPVSASTLKRQRKLILKKAEIEHWIQDGTRKTFATAHRETFKCKLLTSAALGHKGTTVLDEHYDSRLMTSEDAARYWQILPPEPTLVREEAA